MEMGGGVSEKAIEKQRPNPEKEANCVKKKYRRNVDEKEEEEKKLRTMKYDFLKTIANYFTNLKK